jgi:SAM-dependent methyltransferase
MTEFKDPLHRWNSRFSTSGYLFGEEPNKYLKENCELLSKGRVLCIADGDGRNSVWLAEQGFDVTAFDFSPVAVQKARELAKKRSVKIDFVCADWRQFEWKASYFDSVVGIFFQFIGPPERLELFKLMKQSIKVGGSILIQGYGLEQLKYKTGGPDKLDHLYDEDFLKDQFQGYKFLNLKTYTALLNEGSAHSGLSALIGLTVQKIKD